MDGAEALKTLEEAIYLHRVKDRIKTIRWAFEQFHGIYRQAVEIETKKRTFGQRILDLLCTDILK